MTRTVRVVGAVALAVWGAVAAVAVLRPDRLSTAAPLVGLRTDTVGALGYLIATLAFGGAALLTARSAGPRAGVRSALRSGLVLTGGGWLYIAGNALSHPQTLGKQLTHFAQHPLEREFGIGCFVCFLVCAASLVVTGKVRR